MSWDYFKEGSFFGGYHILGLNKATDDQITTKYEVICDVCGEIYVVSHQRMTVRIRNKTTGCRSCANRKSRLKVLKNKKAYFEVFKIGDIVCGKEITNILSKSKHKSGTIYEIRSMCCGTESRMSHEILDNYKKMGIKGTKCRYCKSQENSDKRILDWAAPVPPSVLNDVTNWIWADRGGK